MENENDFARFSKTPTTVELRVMYFIEHTLMAVKSHPISNWVVTIVFFLFLYLNTIITHLVNEEEIKINPIVNDVLSFITSLNFVNSNAYEVKVSLIFVTLIVFTAFFISVFAFSLSIAYRHVLIHIFQILIIYVCPTIFVVFVSVFQHSYMTIGNPWNAASYFGVFGHSLFIFLATLTSLFACVSPYICIHPFFHRNFSSAFISVFYVIIISHLDCYFFKINEAMRIIRLIVSFLICIYILVFIPYYHRHVNALFFSFVFFNFLSSMSIQIMPKKQIFCLYYIPISIVVTVIIFYVVFPLYYKKWFPEKLIFFEFFFGRYDKVRVLLNQIQNPSEINSKYLLNIMTIAFNLDSPKFLPLLRHYFSGKNLYVGDLIHAWIIFHLHETAQFSPTPIFSSLINSNENKIHKLEKEFWYDVWLSDITNLPIISGSIGRKTMNLKMMLYHRNSLIREIFPSLNLVRYKVKLSTDEFIEENKLNKLKSFKNNVKYYFRLHESALFISLILFIIYMIATQVYLAKLSHQRKSYKDLLDFTDEFYLFHFKSGTSLIKLNEKFNKTVSTKLKEIHQYYIDSGFVSSFQDYINVIQKDFYDESSIELFEDFIQKYEAMLSGFLNKFKPLIDSIHRSLKIWYITFLVIFIAFAVFPPIISIIDINRKMIDIFEKFRFIPKREVIKFGNIEPKLSPFEKHWVNSSYSIFRSYPLAITIFFIYSAFSVIYVFLLYNFSLFEWETLDWAELSLFISSNIHRITITLSLATFYDVNEAIDSVQKLVNSFLSDKRLYGLVSRFPQSFYNLVGIVIFNPNATALISINETAVVVDEICQLVRKEVPFESYTTVYEYQRLSFYIVGLSLFSLMFLYIILRIAPIAYNEFAMGNYLYKLIQNQIGLMSVRPDADSSSESLYVSDSNNNNNNNNNNNEISEFEDSELNDISEEIDYVPKKTGLVKKWSIDQIPIIIIVVDDNFKLKYQTNLAKEITGINEGENFKNSNLDNSILFDIKKAFKKFKKESRSPVSIPFQYQQSLVISPFYKSEKTLDYITIVSSNEPPNASIETLNKLNSVFYSVYPKILPLSQTFPFEIQSNGRPFFILFFKLIGFNEWSDKVDLRIVERFRKDVSKSFENLLQNEMNFCRVRETSDIVVLMMNRETKLSIWKILEVCSEFGNNALELIQKLANEYQANEVKGCVLLFKVREPNYYFTSRKCGRSDFKGDSIFAGQARLMNCKPEIVNYTSQKKELKVSNTTKLKTCYTSNGEEYELLIVV